MKWEKKGIIYVPESDHDWRVSHAQVPKVDKVDDDTLRIYYGTRDAHNRTVTTYIDVAADNPSNVLYVHDRPILGLGELGCFDDSGAMPSWIVNHNGLKYLYYIGWNAGVSVSYRNAIGLAVSDDAGQSFTRLHQGPILDRIKTEPHFCSAPCVMVENGIWRMWYLSGVKWLMIEGRSEPIYHLKYAESTDGIDWDRRGIVAIDLKSPEEGGITTPSVMREGSLYKMWYSYRGLSDYRTNRTYTYRIGYAESKDGMQWERKDAIVGLDVSETGWDSEMVAYPHVYTHNGRTYMVYNGNGFGRSGFGYAVLN